MQPLLPPWLQHILSLHKVCKALGPGLPFPPAGQVNRIQPLMHIKHKRGQMSAKQLSVLSKTINICHAEPPFGQLHIQTHGHLLGRVQLPTGVLCVPGSGSRPENSYQEMIWAHFLPATFSAEGLSLEPCYP